MYGQSQGGSILMVLLIGILAVGAIGSYFSQSIINVARGVGWSEKKTQTSYEAENLARLTMKLVQEYVETNADVDEKKLVEFVKPEVYRLTPNKYTLQTFELTVEPDTSIGTIDSGPFMGMQADSRTVQVHLVLLHNDVNVRSDVRLDGVIAGISFLQFAKFSFLHIKQSNHAAAEVTNGRIHANGNICLGAAPWRVSRATASSRILDPHDPACWTSAAPPVGVRLEVATDDTLTNYVPLTKDGDSGCTDCNSTGQSWAQYAINTWNGRVQDKYHNVPELKLKVGSGVQVQDYSGGTWNYMERALVDPVLPDEGASRLAKFAYKADIRIVNGVWYLKDPNDPDKFPGIPVWSDHPGTFSTWDEEGIEGFQEVGQDDIRKRWMSTSNAWPAGYVPKLYSYYEYDPVSGQLVDDTRGVVSYGNLALDTRSGQSQWEPGYYAHNKAPYRNALCRTGNCKNCNANQKLRSALDSKQNVTCSSGQNPSLGALLLNATRSGFRDGTFEASSVPAAEREQRSKIFSMNFDVKAFQEALACDLSSPGEIGCFFGGPSSFMKRPFNGVVYITNTWKGSMAQLTSAGKASRPPLAHDGADSLFLGSNNDASQAPVTHPAQQQALPFQLCSSQGPAPENRAGQPFDASPAGAARFIIPDCARYRQDYTPAKDIIRARTSALRIINGQTIDGSVLPDGLTIASNQKLYVMGDINTNSDTSSAAATPWFPVYFMGDESTLVSNAWEDHNARWDVSRDSLNRKASKTTQNMAISPAVFQLLEDWRGARRVHRGSVVKTHIAVYEELNFPIPATPQTWIVGPSDDQYDPHFEILDNQPPGMPLMTIFAIKTWARK